ncbi:hypothetical protein [Endozoicomonas atrinae]|uniref:hypothetical protein n=1 Tax=Endozoicomonas atrinae TaxID=1333660 RepID=UPI0008240AC0|nr:hypothetical protein [Endozoicomonas atrinae]
MKGWIAGIVLAMGMMMPVSVSATQYCAFNSAGNPIGCYGNFPDCKRVAENNNGWCEVGR